VAESDLFWIDDAEVPLLSGESNWSLDMRLLQELYIETILSFRYRNYISESYNCQGDEILSLVKFQTIRMKMYSYMVGARAKKLGELLDTPWLALALLVLRW
jgi:hypothetical protein